MRRESFFLGVLLVLPVSAQSACIESPVPIRVKIFRTSFNQGNSDVLIKDSDIYFNSGAGSVSDADTIRVDTSIHFQQMRGFGAAMTEASAINLLRLPKALRTQALTALFAKGAGAGFDYIRLPVGASDFSDPEAGIYTYDDSPGNRPDPAFRHFSMTRDEKSFALIREAKILNPDLRVMISPWSPPAWMKDPVSLLGGKLSPAHYRDYAKYLVRVIAEYLKRGIPVESVTIQNEPGYPNGDYPSMGMEPSEQIEFIRDYLAPALLAARMPVGIFVLDHNYDMFGDVNTILDDPRVKAAVAGIAYHCYEGDYPEMANSTARHPDVGIFQTECTGMLGSDMATGFPWWLNNYALSPANMGSTGAMAWNLVLDQEGGPHNNGCEGCAGLITTDFSGTSPVLGFAPEYHALAQISRFVRRGSARVEVSGITDPELNSSAFLNPDGEVNQIIWNGGESAKLLHVNRSECESFDYEIPSKTALTLQWNELQDIPMM